MLAVSPLLTVHKCLSMTSEECNMDEECVDMMEDMLADTSFTPPEVQAYFNLAGSNGTGWFT